MLLFLDEVAATAICGLTNIVINIHIPCEGKTYSIKTFAKSPNKHYISDRGSQCTGLALAV